MLCRGQILFIGPDIASTQCPAVCMLLASHVLINRSIGCCSYLATLPNPPNFCIIALCPIFVYIFLYFASKTGKTILWNQRPVTVFWCESPNLFQGGHPTSKAAPHLHFEDYWGWTFAVSLQCTKGFTLFVLLFIGNCEDFHQVRLFLRSKFKRRCGDSEGQSAAKDGLSANSLITKWKLVDGNTSTLLDIVLSSWTSLCFIKTCSCTQFLLQLNFLLHSCWHTHRAQPIYALAKSTYKLHCSQAAPALMCASAILMKRWRRSTSIQALSRRILRIYLHYSTDAQNVSMLMLHF